MTFASASAPLEPGEHLLEVGFIYDGGLGAGGDLTLSVDGAEVGSARLERTIPVVFSMSGETFDVGMDTGAPVGPYPHVFECTAKIHAVTLERLSDPTPAEREDLARREFRASISSQ
jgi:arylsulfatase